MTKSVHAEAVDQIQQALRPSLKERGFRVRGRTFNRTSEDGLTQVVSIQMGASDPPGTTFIQGLRENRNGWFTVNLGVYVPEVAKHSAAEAGNWVQEYHCCVRARLAEACGETRDLWWRAQADEGVLGDVQHRLDTGGIPFLERFSTRDSILAQWRDRVANMGAGMPPRIVMAIILAGRGDREGARQLLSLQARETRNPGHPAYVRKLADRLAVGALDS